MNPLIVMKNGKRILASSCVGYSLHETTLQNLVNILDFGMDAKTSVETPNFLRPVLKTVGLTQMSLIGVCVLLFVWACVVWPAGHLARSLRKQPCRATRSTHLARFLAALAGALNLGFIIGLILAIQRMTPLVLSLLDIPLLTTALAAGSGIFALLAWKNKSWSLVGRSVYTLIALAALGRVCKL
jgi:hypothetical protein